jgi:ubiquinol-cytochrome c reductase cytochrome b subunit
MNAAFLRIREWLDGRTGLETAVRAFLYERIPGSAGWPHVLGSVAAFAFLVQALTGILLALNYAPTPGDAYNSLQYIIREVTLGRFVRGLHHWGATVMIVAVVLHMGQVFLFGAYRKPREATWTAGVFLLLITLGFGLTGYLLPWDNRAYWGTVVTTRIAHRAPLAGGYLDRLLGSESGIGVVTFARFYGLHTLLLPALAAGLIGFHVYLVRRHGIAPAPGDTRPQKSFFPEQAARDMIAMFSALAILFAMAGFAAPPLERLADPADSSAVPRPDWYFLFLFQMLKLLPGWLEPLGSIVFPGVVVAALLLVPFLDRTRPAAPRRRTAAMAVAGAAAVAWTLLTAAAIVTAPRPPASRPQPAPVARDWRTLAPAELAGVALFRQQECGVCHNLAGGPQKVGPSLSDVRQRRSAEWMIAHFRNPSQVRPGSIMPPVPVSNTELNALSAFLLALNPANAPEFEHAPGVAAEGALVYMNSGCGNCHTVNGVGMQVGPRLNGVSRRHTRDWVERHFADPPALSPGSIMPPYRFARADMDRIVTYLFSIPD